MSPGRTLVPYEGAGTPAVDDACTTGRIMATGAASVCGANGADAWNDGEKSRDQKGSHTALLLLTDSNALPQPEVPPSTRVRLTDVGLGNATVNKANPKTR
jgi:hypothetical protein